MSKPARIQLSRRRGFDLQATSMALNGLPAVSCARPLRWGNPFMIVGSDRGWAVEGPCGFGFFSDHGPALEFAIAQHKAWLAQTPEGRAIAAAAREHLRGKNLACWCKLSDACHCDVLLEIANAEEP